MFCSCICFHEDDAEEEESPFICPLHPPVKNGRSSAPLLMTVIYYKTPGDHFVVRPLVHPIRGRQNLQRYEHVEGVINVANLIANSLLHVLRDDQGLWIFYAQNDSTPTPKYRLPLDEDYYYGTVSPRISAILLGIYRSIDAALWLWEPINLVGRLILYCSVIILLCVPSLVFHSTKQWTITLLSPLIWDTTILIACLKKLALVRDLGRQDRSSILYFFN